MFACQDKSQTPLQDAGRRASLGRSGTLQELTLPWVPSCWCPLAEEGRVKGSARSPV